MSSPAGDFVKACDALIEIRDNNLWREYGSFEKYCKQAFGLDAQEVERLLKVGEDFRKGEAKDS